MYNNNIYTPPEIIARAIKKEFSTPTGEGSQTPSDKKIRLKLILLEIAVLTSPIWGTIGYIILAKRFLGF